MSLAMERTLLLLSALMKNDLKIQVLSVDSKNSESVKVPFCVMTFSILGHIFQYAPFRLRQSFHRRQGYGGQAGGQDGVTSEIRRPDAKLPNITESEKCNLGTFRWKRNEEKCAGICKKR